jgi:hypothetical protein
VELADRLDRTRGGVKWRAAQLGLEVRPVGAWTAEQDELVRRYYGRMPTREIAALVGRSRNAVGQRARILGLEHTRAWRRADLELVRREYPTGDPAAIAAKLGRPGRLRLPEGPAARAARQEVRPAVLGRGPRPGSGSCTPRA